MNDQAEAEVAEMSRLKDHAVTLRGERIILRPMTEDDWEVLLRWNQDAEVLYFTEGDDVASRTLDEVQCIFRGCSQKAYCFIAELAGEPIGECWLQEMNEQRILDEFPGQDLRRIDLAIGEKRLWGQGFGTEMIRLLVRFGFEQECCNAIFGLVGGHNPRSRRAFEKAGFRVLRRVPEPDSTKMMFGYDLIITRPTS